MRLASVAIWLAVTAVAPATAVAGDTTVVADPSVGRITALDGTIAWVTGSGSQPQRLMVRTASGEGPVTGAPVAASAFYRSIDLGRGTDGKLVLTYARCTSGETCTAFRDDLAGHHRRFRGLAPRGCRLTTAPAVWRERIAYGVICGNQRKGTGVYVKSGRHARQLRLPRQATRAGSNIVSAVDLRGQRVAGVASDIKTFVFSETTAGKQRRAFPAGSGEGESESYTSSVALAPGGVLWWLEDAENVSKPYAAFINRAVGSCLQSESMVGPDLPSGYAQRLPATGLAVDGGTLYLAVPGTGIVAHEFAPATAPIC